MPALEVPGVLKFEVTVDEIIQVAREIFKETKQAKVRTALRVMLGELRKGNKELVKEVLAPLCSVKSYQDFDSSFDQLHKRFKELYMGNRPVLAKVNCWKVTQKLVVLKKGQQWKKYLGFARAVTRMEVLVDRWIADDAALYEADREMLEEINGFLDVIGSTKSKRAAYKKFKSGVARIEDRFVATRDQISELEILSSQL